MNFVTKLLTLILLQGAIIATEHNNSKKKALDRPEKITSSLIIGPCSRFKNNYCDNECIKCTHLLNRKPELESKICHEKKKISQRLLNRMNKIITIADIYRHELQLDYSYRYPIERLFMYHNYIKPRYVYHFLIKNKITDIKTIKILKKKWFGDWIYWLPNSK